MPRIPLLPDSCGDLPALLDDRGEWISYDDLRSRARQWAARFSGSRSLVFLYIRNDASNVAALLGIIAAGHVVALFDPNLSREVRDRLEACYQPDWVVEPGAEQEVYGPLNREPTPMDDGLALLLSTSGSTGSPKLVRLSWAAIEVNAKSIAEVLGIEPNDVAAGHLPLHYSYGLSVLTSHLCRGARVRLTELGLMHRAFWPTLREAGVTHLPGVPFHFQVMCKLGLARLGLANLRTLTQAGGALDVTTRRQAHVFMTERGGGFYVLYGQTEAAPRMTTLQHSDFAMAESSVGTPLPGCSIEIENPGEDGVGQVVFHGQNVMLGYAENRDDLILGDLQAGRLPTGDMGRLDEAGRLFLTGRAKRFGKVWGLRVNLDELESEANAIAPTAVTQNGEILRVHLAGAADDAEYMVQTQLMLDHLLARFTLPRPSYEFCRVDEIPRTERGKVDYAALERMG